MPDTDLRERPAKLNLGCGEDYREDWHNVDVSPAVEPDEQVDLAETPWPFADGHFQTVEARHVLEHLERVPWGELGRITAPGGTLRLTYPIGHTRFEDPTHKQYWNYHTAGMLAGDRAHAHEVPGVWTLRDREVDWQIAQAEPLVELYTKYRLLVRGPGPWLGQVPGLAGEVTAVYRREER